MAQNASSTASSMDPDDQLWKLLNDGSDVTLVFAAADGTVEEVPGHLFILKQWSEVLAGAIECSCSSKTQNSAIRIPMTGTKKQDWLLGMQFVYPVASPPELNWDNLEVLLQLGDKYSMPALMHRVSTFIKYRSSELNLQPGELCVGRWIKVLDSYGLTAAAKDCINSQTDLPALVNDGEDAGWLSSLSRDTTQHMMRAMVPWLARPTRGYCSRCAR